jgi:hypothetical protein
MVQETRTAMTPGELAAFSAKLQSWTRTLTPKEAAFLQQMLDDAADAANEDTSGHINFDALGEDDDEVEGHAFGDGKLFDVVAGYAAGVAKAEAEYETVSDVIRGSS